LYYSIVLMILKDGQSYFEIEFVDLNKYEY